ncbi:MAG: asparagine--tRNA ligase, partial [Thermoproteota archaeon]
MSSGSGEVARTHLISQVGPDLEGQEVGLAGWVYRYRDLGSVVFIVLRDATGIIQAVVRSEEVDPSSWEAAKRADVEASVKLAGVVRLDPRAPGGVEVRVTRFKLVGESPDFPIKKDAGVEFRLDKRHLDIRSRRMWAVLRIRAEFMAGLREWFDSNGFIPVEAPTFVSAAV